MKLTGHRSGPFFSKSYNGFFLTVWALSSASRLLLAADKVTKSNNIRVELSFFMDDEENDHWTGAASLQERVSLTPVS